MGWNEKKNAQHLEIQWQCVQDPHESDFTNGSVCWVAQDRVYKNKPTVV
jgi:hypothetical protein